VAARVGNGGAPNDGGYDGDSSSEEHANGNSPGGPSGGSSSSSRFGSRGFDLGSMREPRFTRGAGQGDHGPWQEGSTGKAPADASSSNASEKNTDSEVQEALADILNMEVRKEEVKQEILADLELKKEQLRLIGQELADDFEKEIALDKIRTELASNMSLADTMSRFQELEDEVQALRDSVAADKEELLDWEESTAAARSRSLFFKELYTVKRPKGDDEHGRQIAHCCDSLLFVERPPRCMMLGSTLKLAVVLHGLQEVAVLSVQRESLLTGRLLSKQLLTM